MYTRSNHPEINGLFFSQNKLSRRKIARDLVNDVQVAKPTNIAIRYRLTAKGIVARFQRKMRSLESSWTLPHGDIRARRSREKKLA